MTMAHQANGAVGIPDNQPRRPLEKVGVNVREKGDENKKAGQLEGRLGARGDRHCRDQRSLGSGLLLLNHISIQDALPIIR